MATLPNLANVASSIGGGNFASALATTTGGASSIATSLTGMSLPKLPALPGVPSLTNLTSGLPNLTNLTSGLPKIPPGLPSLDALKNIKPPDLSSATGLLDATKGLSGSAFSAISGSLKSLKAGIPQNLTSINLANKLEQAAADTKLPGLPSADALKQGLNGAGVDAISGKIPSVDSIVAKSGVGSGMNALTGAMNKVPGMAGVAGLNPSAMASGLSNLPGGQSAVSSVINSTTGSTSGISDTLGGLNSITKNISSSALNKISTSTAGTSAVTGLLTGSALTGAGAKLAGVLANPADALKSVGLPGVPSLTGLPNLTGAPSIDSLTKGLTAGKQALSSLATVGLSAAGASALTASMNSLSTSSPNPIKMPTVATSTVDRGEIGDQVSKLLGDKKVPPPDFANAGPTEAALSAIADRDKKRAEFFAAQKKFNEEYNKRQGLLNKEKEEYITFRENYPEGDPTREAARAVINQKIAVRNAWVAEQNTKLKELEIAANTA